MIKRKKFQHIDGTAYLSLEEVMKSVDEFVKSIGRTNVVSISEYEESNSRNGNRTTNIVVFYWG